MNYDPQKEPYSGKKSHSIKNALLTGRNKRILYLGNTHEGSVPDTKMADETDIQFEQKIEWLQDSGFKGFNQKMLLFSSQKRNPGELTQEYNLKIKRQQPKG